MPHFGGFNAARAAQIVPAVGATGAFNTTTVGGEAVAGKLAFAGLLADGDTIAYRALSLDEPSKYEVGIATYVAATRTLTRADANVAYSSNSNARVNFLKADGSGANVLLEGYPLFAGYKWTVTNNTSTRAISGTESAAANVAVALGALVTDLKAAGILG